MLRGYNHTTVGRFSGLGECLAIIAIQILLHADDILLISDTPKGLKIYLNAFKALFKNKGMLINIHKTKVMVFTPCKHGYQDQNHDSSWKRKRWQTHDPTLA